MSKLLKFCFLLTPMIALLISCESKEKEVEQLQKEVIGIHDEVMPKMDDVMKLKKSLKDEMQEADSAQQEEIRNYAAELEVADQAMMDWMRNYDSQMEDMTVDEKLNYLGSQKESILEVRDQMNNSISNAENYLKQ